MYYAYNQYQRPALAAAVPYTGVPGTNNERTYIALAKKPFYNGLCKYFSSGPIVCMVWEGQDVILQGRKLVGATNPNDSEAGSIRGDLCISVGRNIIHGSDGPDSAKHEISMWFKPEEINQYALVLESQLYEN